MTGKKLYAVFYRKDGQDTGRFGVFVALYGVREIAQAHADLANQHRACACIRFYVEALFVENCIDPDEYTYIQTSGGTTCP